MQTHRQPLIQWIEGHRQNDRPEHQGEEGRKDLNREPGDAQQQKQAHIDLHEIMRQHLPNDSKVAIVHRNFAPTAHP